MLSQLLESSPRPQRRHSSALVSIVGHAIILSAAVAAARPLADGNEPETIIAWHPPAPPPPPPPCTDCTSAGRRGGSAEETATLPPVLEGWMGEVNVDVPEHVAPPNDGVVIGSDEWRRNAVEGRSGAPEGGAGRAVVDREVVPFASNPVPRYPPELRAARIEGKVTARFVVDTTGRVIMESVIVDASPHRAFSEAVVEALRRSRFQPAEFRGRKVRQLVSQPFLFVLRD